MPGQSFRSFTERVALVTGGGRHGVGRAVALQLALEGAYVIVTYPPMDAEGERVAAELREIGTLAHAVAGDVARAADVRRIFDFVNDSYGRLDFLVNAASHINRAATPLDAVSEEEWDDALALALKGTFLCAQAGARLMRQRPRPAIVNVVSAAGITAAVGGVSMIAAHAGIVGLTKALARELAPRIRVNCVAIAGGSDPAAPKPHASFERRAHEGEAADVLPRQVIAPDEAARACVYLLSSDAALITGQTLTIG